ncbi:UNVERIFIED_CONTAM: hypothetical protein Sindi_0933800, partial [Sesamum indicum]
AHISNQTFTSLSPPPLTLSPPKPNLTMEDRMNRLEMMMADMMTMMREMWTTSSTTGSSWLTASTSIPALPPTYHWVPN